MDLFRKQVLRSFISQQISFKTKLKIRSFGWKRKSYKNLRHTLCYLKVNFNKYLLFNVPKDDLLRKQFLYELNNYDPYRHQEMIVKIEEPVVVEPLTGAVITKNNYVVEEALSLPHEQTILLPFLPIAIYRISQIKEYLDKAISLRHSWGDNNYFHFYNDILPKLGLLQDLNIFSDYPIIVSQKLYNTSYFQEAIKLAHLENREWFIQDRSTYLGVKELIIIRAHQLTTDGLLRNLRLLKISKPEQVGSKKLFISRSSRNQRNLANCKTIYEIAQRFKFDIVDCSQLTLAEQIDLFSNSRIIVGEHGAAFANIIYRYGNPLNILELFPPHHVSTCYFVISQALDYHHNILRSKSQEDSNYEIEPKAFQEALEKTLESVC